MLYPRTNPIGIDIEIQSIQSDLYTALIALWVDKLDGYGRIYKDFDKEDDKLKPYWYTGEAQYKEVYFNDKLSGNFSFMDDEDHKTEDEFKFTSIVKIVFMLNLKEIFPLDTDRADSKAQRDVVNVLRELSFGKFSIVGIEKGIRNVFRGMDFSSIKFEDQQPLHCFSVNIKLSYHLDEGCTILPNL